MRIVGESSEGITTGTAVSVTPFNYENIEGKKFRTYCYPVKFNNIKIIVKI